MRGCFLFFSYETEGPFCQTSTTKHPFTLPETNGSPMKIPIFPGKYHQNGGFSMAMLVYRGVYPFICCPLKLTPPHLLARLN